ncbi:MAG: DNA translocase FtsK 4TM domain-containing protein [Coriobacteriales bacterium]
MSQPNRSSNTTRRSGTGSTKSTRKPAQARAGSSGAGKSSARATKTKKAPSASAAGKAQPNRRTAAGRAATTRAASATRRAVEVREPEQGRGYTYAPGGADLDGRTRHDIAGVVIGVVGVALLIAVLTPTTGVLTRGVSDALHALLGLGAFIVPLAMIVWAITFFIPTQRVLPGRVALGLGLLALSVISILGITTPGAASDPSLLFNSYVLADRGGYVGNGVGWLLLSLMGQAVGIVLLVGVAVAGLVVIGFSFSDALLSLRLRLRERREMARREQRERAAQLSRAQQQAWLEMQREDDEEARDGYAPTALFDPDRPLSTSADPMGARSGVEPGRAASARNRTFGCGTRPMGMDEEYRPVRERSSASQGFAREVGDASFAAGPDVWGESPLDTHGYAGVDYLPGRGVSPDGPDDVEGRPSLGLSRGIGADEGLSGSRGQSSADLTTFISPASYEVGDVDPLDAELERAGISPDLSADGAVGLRHQGIDAPFDGVAAQGHASLRERVRSKQREQSASRNWWDGSEQSEEPEGDRDLTIPEVPGLAVPGVIEGMPMPGVFDEAVASRGSVDDKGIGAQGVSDSAATAGTMPGVSQASEPVLITPAVEPAVQTPAPAGGSDAAAEPTDKRRTEDGETGVAAKAAPSRPTSHASGLTSSPAAHEPLPWEDPDATVGAPSGAAPAVAAAGASLAASAAGSAADAARDATNPPEAYRRPSPRNLHHNPGGLKKTPEEEAEIRDMADQLARTLSEFKVPAQVVGWVEGPTCTTYEVQPGEGVRVNKFTSLEEDISRSLARESVRIYSPVHGTPYIGIEVPNTTRQSVFFGDVIPGVKGGPLDVAVGLDAEGKPINVDLASLPHLLIAGTTGSGKSVMVNSIICSMLMRDTPDDVRMIMVDPKQVELTGYNGIPHLIMPVVSDPRQAASALQWGVTEMDRRYRVFSTLGVRNISTYNAAIAEQVAGGREFPLKHLPYVVIIIDELTDLMMVAKKDVEASIVRIAQLGRAAGIHLVLATQRPSADVVTGLIKANVGNRMGLKVATGVDSKVVLDQTGAEKLLGRGDMLFLQTKWGDKPRRIQGCFLSDPEIADIVDQLRAQNIQSTDCGMTPIGSSTQLSLDGQLGAAEGHSGGESSANDDDPLAYKAARLVVENQLGSTSMIQRRLKLGYARAGRVMDMLEEMGIVGPARGGKTREVLVHDMDELATIFGSEFPEEEG